MKNLINSKLLLIAVAAFSSSLFIACDDDDNTNNVVNSTIVTQEESNGLLFMLEEEKLARDTYQYLFSIWNHNTFGNIKNSEQNHMNSIAGLLDLYNIEYTILPEGQFENQELQNFYDQFVEDGQQSLIEALKIGATIEDLDIVDLEDYMNQTTNNNILTAYESLQCGSRNHLRAYVTNIISNAGTYTPQFLSLDDFIEIISESHENCN